MIIIWFVLAGLLIIGEIFSLSFYLGLIGVASIGAGLAALLGFSIAIQIIVFIVLSIIAALLARPLSRKYTKNTPHTKTGIAALIDKEAIVLDTVNRDQGQIKLAGEIWSAKSYHPEEIINPNTRVRVIEIKGAEALVIEEDI